MTAIDSKQHPTLAQLFRAGTIWFEGIEIVGRAADGEVVSLGNAIQLEQAEKFLSGAPNPSDW